MQAAAVPEIKWFRTAYVVAEDRFRLACVLVDGGSETLWLTQRLTNALLSKLLEWVEKTVKDDRIAPFVHRAAQKSASAKSPDRRAEKIPEGAGWLVRSIDFRMANDSVMLTFKDDADRKVRLRFGPAHLRQWLNVVHGQYRRAGWPLDLWPEWIVDEAEEASENSGLLH